VRQGGLLTRPPELILKEELGSEPMEHCASHVSASLCPIEVQRTQVDGRACERHFRTGWKQCAASDPCSRASNLIGVRLSPGASCRPRSAVAAHRSEP